MPKAFYRRKLPHLQRDDRPHFVTFCTYQRWILPEPARSIALGCCLHDNHVKMTVHGVVVMPDHVHVIFTPLINQLALEVYSLAETMDAIKGASAHKINHALERRGKVWQTESFDRVLRSSEALDQRSRMCWRIRYGEAWFLNGRTIRGRGVGPLPIPTLLNHPRSGSRPPLSPEKQIQSH